MCCLLPPGSRLPFVLRYLDREYDAAAIGIIMEPLHFCLRFFAVSKTPTHAGTPDDEQSTET
jgi:hypothetical protein